MNLAPFSFATSQLPMFLLTYLIYPTRLLAILVLGVVLQWLFLKTERPMPERFKSTLSNKFLIILDNSKVLFGTVWIDTTPMFSNESSAVLN